MTDDSIIELYECEQCKFRFFDPQFTGSAAFYEVLARNTYYATMTPEFDEVLQFAATRGIKSVIDLGCGHGAFLDLAATRGFSTAGIEFTPAAAEQARLRGHQVLTTPMEQLRDGDLPPAGLVTAFQVLEHVQHPVEFVRQAKQLLAPGGLLALAVPYETGVAGWADLAPHQWPPHHLTRWTKRDLTSVGEQHGLEVLQIRANSLSGRELRRYLRLNRRMGNGLTPPRPRMPGWLAGLLGWAYSLSGGKYWFPKIGTSVTAIYQVR